MARWMGVKREINFLHQIFDINGQLLNAKKKIYIKFNNKTLFLTEN